MFSIRGDFTSIPLQGRNNSGRDNSGIHCVKWAPFLFSYSKNRLYEKRYVSSFNSLSPPPHWITSTHNTFGDLPLILMSLRLFLTCIIFIFPVHISRSLRMTTQNIVCREISPTLFVSLKEAKKSCNILLQVQLYFKQLVIKMINLES